MPIRPPSPVGSGQASGAVKQDNRPAARAAAMGHSPTRAPRRRRLAPLDEIERPDGGRQDQRKGGDAEELEGQIGKGGAGRAEQVGGRLFRGKAQDSDR